MARLATFEWRTPPPTSVDEVLALFDDASAVLAVRRPGREVATIGSYRCRPPADDLRLLTAAGPGPIVFELLAPVGDASLVRLMAAADRVRAACLAEPRATATFHVHAPGSGADDRLDVTLLVVAAGTDAVEFELDPSASSVHFAGLEGRPISWHDLPPLPTGFVTADAVGLGGIRGAAHIEPGAYGAIAFPAAPPPGAAGIAVLVAGWLRDTFPDEPTPASFSVRTALVPIAG
jgi:hypothetical protein